MHASRNHDIINSISYIQIFKHDIIKQVDWECQKAADWMYMYVKSLPVLLNK
jgi:hypothetical protein